MPVTRSLTQQPRQQPFPTSSALHSQTQNTARMTSPTETVTVVITSSEGKPTTLKAKRSKRKETSTLRPKPTVAPPEVIEISSDDEDFPPSRRKTTIKQPTAAVTIPPPEPATIAEFRRQINKYREEAAKSKRDLERLTKETSAIREENKELQALCKSKNGQITLDANTLTDQLDCEICTTRMWTPYILPDCGHAFCQSCIQDWFGATQAQYMASNPGYNPNQLISNQNVIGLYNIAQTITLNPHAANSPQISALLTQLLPAHPQYTCPTCREPVTTRPTEAFTLKALVRTVAAAVGESSPKKSKAPVKAPGESPWDGFFPRKG